MKDALAEYAVKEAFLKKAQAFFGKTTRKITSAEDKAKILQFIDEKHQALTLLLRISAVDNLK